MSVLQRRFNIALNDAPVGTAAGNIAGIEPFALRQVARSWRDFPDCFRLESRAWRKINGDRWYFGRRILRWLLRPLASQGLTGFAHDGNIRQHRHFVAHINQARQQGAGGGAFDFQGGFVSLDFAEQLAHGNALADLNMPGEQDGAFDCVAEFGQNDAFRHARSMCICTASVHLHRV